MRLEHLLSGDGGLEVAVLDGALGSQAKAGSPLAILVKVASAVPAWRGGLRPRLMLGAVASLLAQLVRAPH